jgi:hypothetical protein
MQEEAKNIPHEGKNLKHPKKRQAWYTQEAEGNTEKRKECVKRDSMEDTLWILQTLFSLLH